MNPITDIIFSITWILLFVWAIRTMIGGWKFVSEDASRPRGTWTTQVTKKIHPEMIDVQPGDQLMGVTFDSSSCDLEEYKSLRERIEKLKSKLEGEDEDDDEDGDVVVRI
tara:strand:+ start:228 stop:557 length:330 start_codon:yes stop_codon:yes gene_type:complete